MSGQNTPFAFSGGQGQRETPDIETSSEDYAGRFAGPVGNWFLEVQAASVLQMLAPWPGAKVLELGGGHAQLAGPLHQAGYRVTVTGSSLEAGARLARLLPAGSYTYLAGDLLDLPFAEQSFDVVLGVRLLAHVRDWPRLLGQMCRVARRAVVVDYAEMVSFNLISEKLYGAKLAVERNTRPFQCFYGKDLRAAFGGLGFQAFTTRPQFFWPMALHRGLGRAELSRGLENASRALGLTRFLGSPVILRASRV
jgi:SAM-dependent methyltransferase